MQRLRRPSQDATRPIDRAARAATLLLALTSIHHAYGAVIYDTPWRLHILVLAVPAAAAILALAAVSTARPRSTLSRLSGWLTVVLILAFPVAMIGLFEGGYNHVLKNLVFFGLGHSAAAQLFAGPAYEMPNDVLFELSGIAQFPLAIVVIARLMVGKSLRGSAIA